MRKLGIAVGLLVWAMVLFVAVFWLTFPSETLANRIRYEVPLRLGEEWSADVDSVSPWWAGVSVKKVKLYRETPDEEGVVAPQLAALIDVASVKLAVNSLWRGAPYLKGRTTLTEGDVAWEVGTAMEGGKGARISDLVLTSDALPIGDLLAMAGAPASVTGTVAMAVDLRGGENGMRDAAGSISLDGGDLVVSDLEIPGLGPLGMEVPISTLSIHAKVEKGRATFEQSRIVSELFTMDLSGDVTLRDPLDRSTVAVKIVLSNLGSQLAAFEGFMGDAKNSEGNYEFTCRGNLSRIAESCSAGPERRSTRPTARPPSTTSSGSDETDEDRARSRQEIQDRVRKRREERENRRNGTTTAPVAPVIEPDEEEEEEPVEEPIEEPGDHEELGPDEEEPLE